MESAIEVAPGIYSLVPKCEGPGAPILLGRTRIVSLLGEGSSCGSAGYVLQAAGFYFELAHLVFLDLA